MRNGYSKGGVSACFVLAFGALVCSAAGVDTDVRGFYQGVVPGPVAVTQTGPDVPSQDGAGLANLALRPEAKAAASGCLKGHAIHQTAHLNDGKYGNRFSWISAGEETPWVEIDLGGEFWVCRVALGTDSTGALRDRALALFEVLADGKRVFGYSGDPVVLRREFSFEPVRARKIRVAISGGASVRIDELEIYGGVEKPSKEQVGAVYAEAAGDLESQIRMAILGEEHAWLKTAGYADIEAHLRITPYPERRYAAHKPDDVLPLPTLTEEPKGELWRETSEGTVRFVLIDSWAAGPLKEQKIEAAIFSNDLYVAVSAEKFLSAHLTQIGLCDLSKRGFIVNGKEGLFWREVASNGQLTNEPVRVEGSLSANGKRLEVKLPLVWFPDYAKKGLYATGGIGGRWVPAGGRPVNFISAPFALRAVPSDTPEQFALKIAALGLGGGIVVTTDSDDNIREDLRSFRWPYAIVSRCRPRISAVGRELNVSAKDTGGNEYRLTLLRYEPARPMLNLYRDLVERRKADSAQLEKFAKADLTDRAVLREIARAKRDLFLTDEGFEPLRKLLFSKRHPFRPSHNYSVQFDAAWRPGGNVSQIEMPFEKGRLVPEKGVVTELVPAGKDGVIRDPAPDFDGEKIYYSLRENFKEYYRIHELNLRTGLTRRISPEGPFHDFWPTPLPDGGLAMISTRIKKKFICWRPQAAVLFRIERDGSDAKPLSFANLTEFAPAVMEDGRLVWTRSEYNDKGADYGHMLWTIRADGTYPELAFGNTLALPQGFANSRQMPVTREWCGVMISHFGDLNGPVALMDATKSPHDPSAVRNITPEIPWPGYPGYSETFREPYPITRDAILIAWAPQDRFGLFLIDRYGNRELLYMDAGIDSICAIPLRKGAVPPVRRGTVKPELEARNQGQFSVENVYKGLEGQVQPGAAKWLRICEELPTYLRTMPDGTYQADHDPFMQWYASPVDRVGGPFGWPTYIGKGVIGTVPVEKDGSVNFTVPSGKVLYFQILDENYNEIQRMRSVLQMQAGETRSCIGCHESRLLTPTQAYLKADAMKKPPAQPAPPPWGAGPFWFEKVVQPVLDKRCVSCHNAAKPNKIDLSDTRDAESIPVSYANLVRSGTIHYFHYGYQAGVPYKAAPYTFGTVKSRLWTILKDKNHADVKLSDAESQALKCWTDLNLPLWGDYSFRPERKTVRPQDIDRWVP